MTRAACGLARCRIDYGYRGVAQFGRARGLGPRSRRFKSCHPDYCSGIGLMSGRRTVLIRRRTKSCRPRFQAASFTRVALTKGIEQLLSTNRLFRFGQYHCRCVGPKRTASLNGRRSASPDPEIPPTSQTAKTCGSCRALRLPIAMRSHPVRTSPERMRQAENTSTDC